MTQGRNLGFIAAQQKTSHVICNGHKIKVKQLLQENNRALSDPEVHLSASGVRLECTC